MKFIVDAQLPPGLAHWLVECGHEAEHVADIGLHAASDRIIWEHANASKSVIITKDEDFAEEVRRGDEGVSVVWLRVGNTTTKVLLKWLEPRWAQICSLLDNGDRLIEVR